MRERQTTLPPSGGIVTLTDVPRSDVSGWHSAARLVDELLPVRAPEAEVRALLADRERRARTRTTPARRVGRERL